MNSDGFVTWRKAPARLLGLVATASISPRSKSPPSCEAHLLKQHGVLWYSEPVFEFFAMESMHSMGSKCGPYTDFKDKRQFFFLTPPAISFSQCVLRAIS
jgi:hypothetical protein